MQPNQQQEVQDYAPIPFPPVPRSLNNSRRRPPLHSSSRQIHASSVPVVFHKLPPSQPKIRPLHSSCVEPPSLILPPSPARSPPPFVGNQISAQSISRRPRARSMFTHSSSAPVTSFLPQMNNDEDPLVVSSAVRMSNMSLGARGSECPLPRHKHSIYESIQSKREEDIIETANVHNPDASFDDGLQFALS